jgi:hypothetical protein
MEAYESCEARQQRPSLLARLVHCEARFRSPEYTYPGYQGESLYEDYRLPSYESYADERHIDFGTPKQQDEYGTTYIDRWTMDDEFGTQYNVMRCLAAEPKTDVWVVKDTAWSTQVTGLNTDVARKLMGLGFNVLIKGPEIGSSIPLSNSAFNTHQILDGLERRGDISASRIAVEGYSRGSMIGFGTNAYAESFDRDVLFSNLTDPCVALPVKVAPFDAETAKKAATLPLDITMLGVAIAKGLSHPVRGRHIAQTIDPSWDGLKQFYRTGKPLMNGEAGMMAAKTPKDMKATIAFFRRCRVNDAPTYQAILADHPKVRFVRPEGGHGGGIDSRIIGNVAVRFGRLLEQLQEGRQTHE